AGRERRERGEREDARDRFRRRQAVGRRRPVREGKEALASAAVAAVVAAALAGSPIGPPPAPVVRARRRPGPAAARRPPRTRGRPARTGRGRTACRESRPLPARW